MEIIFSKVVSHGVACGSRSVGRIERNGETT